MKPVFADTFYFIAFTSESDRAHRRALTFGKSFTGSILTTTWIITELADAFAATDKRSNIVGFIENLSNDPFVTVVPPSLRLFERGLSLYASRVDKAWSLTDCISFIVMKDAGVTEALTGDRHFEQAGFQALLK